MSNTNIFDKWDNTIDLEGLTKDIQDAEQNNTRNYKEVPHGDYEVAVHQMDVKPSKNGNPMVSIWFKIVSEGEFKGSMIFMNQPISQGFQVHIVNAILRTMTSELSDAPEIEFKSYKQYKNLVMDVFESINENFEYALSYKKGKGDFSTFEITEVYTLE